MARSISWRKLVEEADPELKKPPTVYKFGKGKEFKDKKDPYEGAKN